MAFKMNLIGLLLCAIVCLDQLLIDSTQMHGVKVIRKWIGIVTLLAK